MKEEYIKIEVSAGREVSAIQVIPTNSVAMIIIAHGAGVGAGMNHAFMAQIANELWSRQIATFRFNFLYMEEGKKRPDTKNIAVDTYNKVINYVLNTTDLPVYIGGKSFGGRMASWAEVSNSNNDIKGLIYWGFPLHAPGRPSDDRADHMLSITKPMLFLQGTRDTLSDLTLLKPVVEKISKAKLYISEGSDHSFHVLKRSGRNDLEVIEEISNEVKAWISKTLKTA